MERSIRTFFWISLLISCVAVSGDRDLESKVKAAYIVNFTKFVQWIGDSGDTMNICVIGNNAIAEILKEFSARNKGRRFSVEQGPIENLKQCRVLYIDQSEPMISELIAKAQGDNILTVSDAKHFAQQGGIIGFYIEDGKVKLEINQQMAETSNLKISSNLMEIARIVY